MQIAAIIIIILCLIAIAYRDLKISLLSLGAILLTAGLFYFLSPKDSADTGLLKDISLEQSKISQGYANGFVLNTRINNKHASQVLQSAVIRSTLSDCNADRSECLTIGEEDHLVKIRIPPGQARDTQINLRIKLLNPLRGESSWEHAVIGAK